MVDFIDIAARPSYRLLDYLILTIGWIELYLLVHIRLRGDSRLLFFLLIRLASSSGGSNLTEGFH